LAKRNYSHYPGWLILDKSLGVSSAKAVNIIKKFFNVKKAGHAGTLDPLASGVLPIALDDATKTIPYLVNAKKKYKFIITWGQKTETDDSEGKVIEESDVRPEPEEIKKILSSFIGSIIQTPPHYSAIKINGKRAYSLARENIDFEMPKRSVDVFDLKLLRLIDYDSAEFEVFCGKGFYVRSLAREIAEKLNTFGHIKELIRLEVGPFKLKNAFPLETFDNLVHSPREGSVDKQFLLPLDSVLDDIPALTISEEEVKMFRHGQSISKKISSDLIPQGGDVLINDGVKSIGIAVFLESKLKPKKVFSSII
tara:strand:- start:4317 stop:5243 length:927 start_codon:yes stop_codon:yes gene_type:complete